MHLCSLGRARLAELYQKPLVAHSPGWLADSRVAHRHSLSDLCGVHCRYHAPELGKIQQDIEERLAKALPSFEHGGHHEEIGGGRGFLLQQAPVDAHDDLSARCAWTSICDSRNGEW